MKDLVSRGWADCDEGRIATAGKNLTAYSGRESPIADRLYTGIIAIFTEEAQRNDKVMAGFILDIDNVCAAIACSADAAKYLGTACASVASAAKSAKDDCRKSPGLLNGIVASYEADKVAAGHRSTIRSSRARSIVAISSWCVRNWTTTMVLEYLNMPRGSENGGTEWMNDLPARYTDGKRGFDRRIMEQLAAVGVPCYTVQNLILRGPSSIPAGIPIFIDWLANLETRIPGPETEHRSIVRSGLISSLDDVAARGNQQAIDLLDQQLRHQPPLPQPTLDWASQALRKIATKKNFEQIAALLAEAPSGPHFIWLIEYLGKVKTPEARDLAISYLDGFATEFAIKALVQMKATGVRDLIEPFVDDPAPQVRRQALRALDRLPE